MASQWKFSLLTRRYILLYSIHKCTNIIIKFNTEKSIYYKINITMLQNLKIHLLQNVLQNQNLLQILLISKLSD